MPEAIILFAVEPHLVDSLLDQRMLIDAYLVAAIYTTVLRLTCE
jgi:hypothetical protein